MISSPFIAVTSFTSPSMKLRPQKLLLFNCIGVYMLDNFKFASSEIFALAGVICIGFGSLWCVACLTASITCYALGWGEA